MELSTLKDIAKLKLKETKRCLTFVIINKEIMAINLGQNYNTTVYCEESTDAKVAYTIFN